MLKYLMMALLTIGLTGCCGDLKGENVRMSQEIQGLQTSLDECSTNLGECAANLEAAEAACQAAIPVSKPSLVTETDFVTSPCTEALTVRLSQLDESRVYLQYAVDSGPESGSYYSDALYHNEGKKRHRNSILVGSILITVDYCGPSSCQVSCLDLTVDNLTCEIE